MPPAAQGPRDAADQRVDVVPAPGPDEAPAAEPGWAGASGQAEDWLDRICPYLLSEDGTYRSSQPDAGHRCTAQDPPGTLPLAFQERFCLSERHVRCEMFKVAQSARSAAFDQEGIPAEQIRSARFKPSVRSVPLALGPSSGSSESRDRDSRRPLIAAGIGIVVLSVLVFLIVLLVSGGGGSGPAPDASPSAIATLSPSDAPAITPAPTVRPTSAPSSSPGADPGTSSPPAAGGTRIEYEVQEDEALIAIAEAFGTSRREILLANPAIAQQKPYTKPGDIIIVPVSPDMTPADIEAVPGFIRYLE